MRAMRGKVRAGVIVDVVLLSILLSLAYVFLRRHQSNASYDIVYDDDGIAAQVEVQVRREPLEVRKENGVPHRKVARLDSAAQNLLDARVKMIPDARSKKCRQQTFIVPEKATLIATFNDYQFYDLKNTMSSVLHDDTDALEEIIFVDDGSTLDYIIEDAEKLVKMLPKSTRMLRSKVQLGSTRARMLALNESKMDIVVFLDSTVLCNRGWLVPLLEIVADDKSTIAVPHFDRILSPVSIEYQPTADNLIPALSWTFEVRMQEYEALSPVAPYREDYASPVLRGNVFAVRKSFLESIGSFDAGFEDDGGEILELSLRTWLCGGSIMISPCSRVGVLNLNDPVKVATHLNIRRIAELWFDARKDIVYRMTGASPDVTDSERQSIDARRKSIPNVDRCKKIDWFFKNVAQNTAMPSADVVHFGLLQVRSSRCASLGRDSRIDLHACRTDTQRIDSVFELTKDGRILVAGKCLTVSGTAYIVGEDCRPVDRQQLWKYVDGQQLVNDWSGFCATHVTDPDKTLSSQRQIIMAQNCASESPEAANFKSWQFIML